MNHDEIKKEARILLDRFGKDLQKIKTESKKLGSEGKLREEKKGEFCDVEFKTIMFKNAPHKYSEYLLLEKGHWN